MCDFLGILVSTSATYQYHRQTDERYIKYVSFSTLCNWKVDLCSMLQHMYGLETVTKSFREKIADHCVELSREYGLSQQQLIRLTFSTGEIRVLLESILNGQHRKSQEVSIQLASLIVLFYYTVGPLGLR